MDPGLHCLCLEPPVASGQWGELGAWSTQAGHLPEQGRQGEAVRGSGHDRVGGTLFPCATEGGFAVTRPPDFSEIKLSGFFGVNYPHFKVLASSFLKYF